MGRLLIAVSPEQRLFQSGTRPYHSCSKLRYTIRAHFMSHVEGASQKALESVLKVTGACFNVLQCIWHRIIRRRVVVTALLPWWGNSD